ncbi:MAG: AMP-binding protein [Acidimicrobiales bacterium]
MATDTAAAGLTHLSLATVWEAVARAVPDAPALFHGPLERNWREFEARSARFAGHLDSAGLRPDSKVALYCYNGPEYLEATFGAFKARCVPVNVNYRYLEGELTYLLDNSDAEAVVFSADLADRLHAVRPALPKIATFICVGADDAHPVPDWAIDFDTALDQADPMPPIDRSGDDLWFLYTGGTTGMPKGVMWPHRSLLGIAGATFRIIKAPVPSTVDEVESTARAFHERGKAVRLLPAAPLMHGTSAMTTIGVLCSGGSVTTLTSTSLDGDEICATVADRRISQLTIVGDAFAKPIVAALEAAEAAGRPYDWTAVRMIVSSGVMWSRPVKDSLLEHCDAMLADLLGSSEGVGFGSSVARRGAATDTAKFALGEHAQVFNEAGRAVEPGSGEVGMLAVGGPIPIGYYKDPDKSAGTFRTIEGRTWSVPGDFATVEADGTISLLGRGSVCINTAGEKVYPEEVEETLKLHPSVRDSNVVGLPDEKWGQAVTALVEIERGSELSGSDAGAVKTELVSFTKQHLSGYKCPKAVFVVDRIQRGPNGKADYRWAADLAARLTATPDTRP